MKSKRIGWAAAIIAGLVLLAAVGMLAADFFWEYEEDSWYTGFPSEAPWYDKEYDQIHQPRLLLVPEAHLDEAIALLANTEIVELDLPKARLMLDMPDLDPDTLLKAAIAEEIAKAEKEEDEAKEPFLAYHAKRCLEEAKEHRLSAKKAEEMLGKTKPYLVRALMFQELTGGFEVYWKDSSLWIHHGCLGHRAVPMKRRPLIIFLEKKPASVYNNVSMAE